MMVSLLFLSLFLFFFSSRRRHTRCLSDWSSDVCSSDLAAAPTLERPLPQNLDAERSILGAILLDNHALNAAVQNLKPEDFFLEQHRRRSEERRVGKEGRSRWATYHSKKQETIQKCDKCR